MSVYFLIVLTYYVKEGKINLSTYGLEFEMEHRIVQKFKEAGAISMEAAVSEEDAKLDVHEQFWLEYFAGIFFEKIKKTQKHMYYV